MIKLLKLLQPLTENADGSLKNINDTFEIDLDGFLEIENLIDKINKTFKKNKLPHLELEILNTKEITKPWHPDITKTIYTIKLTGSAPIIDKYEFVGKIEHTANGNIINLGQNTNPQELPREYRTFDQRCDVCKTNRERNNTFILQKTDTREFVVCGSGCLKRIFPAADAKRLLDYAASLQAIRNAFIENDYGGGSARGFDDDGGYRPKKVDMLDINRILFFGLIAYLEQGRFIPNKTGVGSTAYVADYLMANQKDDSVQKIIKKHNETALTMLKKLKKWIEDFDFDKAANNKPDMGVYFNNMKVIFKSNVVKVDKFNYVISIISSYLRDTQTKKDVENDIKIQSNYVGKIGDTITTRVRITNLKEFSGFYGKTTLVAFKDENGNDLIWFASGEKRDQYTPVLNDKKLITITGTVSKHEISKYTKQPETTLNRVKIKI